LSHRNEILVLPHDIPGQIFHVWRYRWSIIDRIVIQVLYFIDPVATHAKKRDDRAAHRSALAARRGADGKAIRDEWAERKQGNEQLQGSDASIRPHPIHDCQKDKSKEGPPALLLAHQKQEEE
jgi:hypothetical protein